MILAVHSMKGGVGKTATAVELAWISAAAGTPTLLWDLDPQGAASFSYRVRPELPGGIEELLAAGPENAIKASDYAHLDVLPADPSLRELELLLEKKGEQKLAGVLARLGEYGNVVLDCPPGAGNLADAVCAVADVVLIPTIPTVLSLRTLAATLKQAKHGRERGAVHYFFCMVDRRRSLHREITAWARAEKLGFLETEIPYTSVVEQMGVRRTALSAYAPASAPARAYERLWDELRERLAQGTERRPDVRAELLGFCRTGPRRVETRRPARAPREELEVKLHVNGASDFDALARAVGAEPGPPVRQVNHFFDTADRALRASDCALRLRDEAGRYLLTAKGDERREDALARRAEEEVELAPEEAAAILRGERSPLEALAERVGHPSPLVETLLDAVGEAPLHHAGSFTNLRRRLGPVRLTPKDGTVTFELDTTEFPGGRIDHEIEAEFTSPTQAAAARAPLAALLESAGLPWRPASSKAQRFFEALAEETRSPAEPPPGQAW